MGHYSCCVVNCKNTSRNSKCKFYKFPKANWKIEQRKKWIAAVKRKNPNGSLWFPKPYDVICSDHFLGGKKSEEELNPSYIPTIFPSIYKQKKVDTLACINRHQRYKHRRDLKEMLNTSKMKVSNELLIEEQVKIELKSEVIADDTVSYKDQIIYKDQVCQADIYISDDRSSETFICNRYIYNTFCDAQTQTEITKCTVPIKVEECE